MDLSRFGQCLMAFSLKRNKCTAFLKRRDGEDGFFVRTEPGPREFSDSVINGRHVSPFGEFRGSLRERNSGVELKRRIHSTQSLLAPARKLHKRAKRTSSQTTGGSVFISKASGKGEDVPPSLHYGVTRKKRPRLLSEVVLRTVK